MAWTRRRTNVFRTANTRCCASWVAARALAGSPRSSSGASRRSVRIGRGFSRRWTCRATPSSSTTSCSGDWPSRCEGRDHGRRRTLSLVEKRVSRTKFRTGKSPVGGSPIVPPAGLLHHHSSVTDCPHSLKPENARQGRAPFMMRWIVGSSLQYRFLVVGIAAAMMVFGITRLGHMPVDVFPEFAPPTAEIQTEALGLSAAEVENLVTLNTEELLAGVPWLKTMRSRSVPGMSSVQLIFQPGTNLMQARQLVQERLILSYLLPNRSERPVMLNPVSATSRTMMIGVSSKKLSPLELSVLARWTIKPRLMGVPGVANVSVWGHRERQLQVQIDPERLRAHGITQEQIIKTTGDSLWVSPLTFLNASFPGTGGWIDTPNQRLGVQHVLPISTPEDLARVPVDGAKVRLGDVATVVEGHPLLIGDAFHTGGAGLMMVIEKFPGTNTLEVTRGIDAALDALRPGLPGVDVDSRIFRAATFIEMAFDNLTTALLLGGLLVVIVLGAFLASWRTAVISLIAIPLSLLTAALVLYVRGATLNTMVLAGFVIAVGAIVDDAIVAVDQVVRELRRRRQEGSKDSTSSIIRDALLDVGRPVLYATLIVVIAFVPVLFMEGLSGAFFRPLAVSYVLAVLASLVVALTVTPALALMLLGNGAVQASEGPLVRTVQRGYDAFLARTIRAPRAALVTAVGLVVVAIAVWPLLGQSYLPSFKERHLLIDWVGQAGTSHPAMTRVMNQAARELRTVPGVSNVSAHLGRAITGDQVVGINASQLWLTIDPRPITRRRSPPSSGWSTAIP